MTRFNKELKIIKIIKHPNIIKLLEIIETNSKIYLIFEHYPHNLLNYIESEKKLSENKARFFFQQLISALNYLHLMGVSHRNIKPENVLLDENYTKIKITGFEVSTFCKSGCLLNSPVGTLIYAPPEMILSQNYKGELNDIWDAGIVLYAMVCGNLPFSQDSADININHIIEGFYDIPKDISSNCVEVIKNCLECKPEKRITFDNLKKLKWIADKNFNYIKGININEERIFVDDKILQECKKYISANNQDILYKIKKSVIENKFDEFSSLYYLVLQKKIKNGYQSILDLNKDNKNNKIIKFINLTNSNEDNISYKDLLINYTHTHTNSFSSFILNRHKFDYFDNFKNDNISIVNKDVNSQTIRSDRSDKKHRNNIININSNNFKIDNYIFSPKHKINIDNRINHKSLLNTFKQNELNNNVMPNAIPNVMPTSPTIYRKKISFISKPKFSNLKSKSNCKIIKYNTKTYACSSNKIKIEDDNNENNDYNINNNSNNISNKKNNDDDSQPLNTLFVNRVKNITNNFYIQKKKNKSSEGFYHSSKNKNTFNKTKTNLISINKKNLFINVNNNQNNKEKNDINIDKILMNDKPVENFSMNFNSTLLNNNYNKKILNDLDQNQINANKCNISETEYTNKQSVIKKQRKNAKSYKRLDYFFETPKKNRETNNNIKYNLKNNHYFKLNSSNKGNISISESLNKYFPTKKFIRPSVLRNTMNEQHYNTTVFHDDKSLNHIKTCGGTKIAQKSIENNLHNIFKQNEFTSQDKVKNSKYSAKTYKVKNNKKEYKKIEQNLYYSKFKESTNLNNLINTNNMVNDIGVLDLSCLKYCSYQILIDKIYKILKKNKIKYCLINSNKIHCSGKNGMFFDIEIKDLKNKKNVINKKMGNNSNNIYKKNTIEKNNKLSVQQLGNTYLNFKKNVNNKIDNKKNELYYITFYCKKNEFKKKNEQLIHEILG